VANPEDDSLERQPSEPEILPEAPAALPQVADVLLDTEASSPQVTGILPDETDLTPESGAPLPELVEAPVDSGDVLIVTDSAAQETPTLQGGESV
jgi:hypothetical protein